MSHTKEICHQGVRIQVIDALTGQPYYIKDNLIVLCEEGKQFKLGFYSEGRANITVWLQGSQIPAGTFRTKPGRWVVFEHGSSTQATWVTLNSKTQEAKGVGIKEGSAENGLLRFKVEVEKEKPANFFESRPANYRGMRKGFSSFGSRLEMTRSCDSSAFDDESGSDEEESVPESREEGGPRYSEVGIAHGHDSTEKYGNAKIILIDSTKTFHFVARMVADQEALKPKFSPIPTLPPTAADLNQ